MDSFLRACWVHSLIQLVSLLWTPRYSGHFLSGLQVSTLARFYCTVYWICYHIRHLQFAFWTYFAEIPREVLLWRITGRFTISSPVSTNILWQCLPQIHTCKYRDITSQLPRCSDLQTSLPENLYTVFFLINAPVRLQGHSWLHG